MFIKVNQCFNLSPLQYKVATYLQCKKEDNEMIVFIVPAVSYTSRGKRRLIYDGYQYTEHLKIGVKVRWRCTTHCNYGCRAIILTIDGHVSCQRYEHNHGSSLSRVTR